MEQVLLFMAQNKRYGIVKVCDFLRPFLNFSILRISLSNSTSSSFVRHLISSMASLGCSFHDEAMPILKLLVQCLKYYPCHNAEVSLLFGEFFSISAVYFYKFVVAVSSRILIF